MNLKKQFGIVNRIASGYVVIIAIIFFFTALGQFILSQNNKKSDAIFSVEVPILFSAKNFIFLVSESKRLTRNWIYLSNLTEKEQLQRTHSQTFPNLKNELMSAVTKLEDEKEYNKIKYLLVVFDSIIGIEQQIMRNLAFDEDYANDVKVVASVTIFEKELTPKVNHLLNQLEHFYDKKNKTVFESMIVQRGENDRLLNTLKLMLILVLLVSVVIYFLTKRIITKPMENLKNIVLSLGKGEIVDIGELKNRNSLLDGYKTDEIGQMTEAVESLVEGVKLKTSFANEIGRGNYDQEFQKLSEKDTMGIALIEMRSNLKKIAEDDKRRNWATAGLAKFGEILRQNNDNIEVLGNDIISNLVKYLNANQGGLFIINENNKQDIHLELIACYAFERKKYLTKKISKGEGLVGQTWEEGEYIYLTDVPNDYVHITSGLGDANPRSILIMPLKINEKIFGVMEIASFNPLEKFEIEFVQKLSESIASTISTAKINEQTKRLLHESQQQSEELKSQEEEMRQNMEEMAATQEEMQRKEKDYRAQIEEFKKR